MGLAFYLWTIAGTVGMAYLIRKYGRPYTQYSALQPGETGSDLSAPEHEDLEAKAINADPSVVGESAVPELETLGGRQGRKH